MYPLLAAVFFVSIAMGMFLVLSAVLRTKIWRERRPSLLFFGLIWFVPYFIFVAFFTGPVELSRYPIAETSPYRLPWKVGDTRFVAQGNRSFTSHRGSQTYAWDFVMPNGTEILAAREGKVVEVVHDFTGIGLESNFIRLEHSDEQTSVYAHIKHQGSLVKVGDYVTQGTAIALSGMVGQTIFPHLHFYVTGKDRVNSIPVSFHDVEGKIPFAGRSYISGNTRDATALERVRDSITKSTWSNGLSGWSSVLEFESCSAVSCAVKVIFSSPQICRGSETSNEWCSELRDSGTALFTAEGFLFTSGDGTAKAFCRLTREESGTTRNKLEGKECPDSFTSMMAHTKK